MTLETAFNKVIFLNILTIHILHYVIFELPFTIIWEGAFKLQMNDFMLKRKPFKKIRELELIQCFSTC